MKLISNTAMSCLIAHDMNAARYVWLRENWHSEMDGERVPEWIGKRLLRYGGLDKCVDLLMTASPTEHTTPQIVSWDDPENCWDKSGTEK